MRRPVPARAIALLACAALLPGCGVRHHGSDVVSAKAAHADWTRFDYDAQRSGVGPADTGITADNAADLRTRVVDIDGTVDSSPILLHAIRVRGRLRDVIVVTTSYGHTIAIDALAGQVLWEYKPPGIASIEGSSQVTTATPVADPNRRYVYAASPDGVIHKLAVATGAEVRSGGWPVRITLDPRREKIGGALNLNNDHVIAAVGGYIENQQKAQNWQGHVVVIDRSSGHVANVYNALCSNRQTLVVPSSCSASGAAIWARSGALVEPGSGRLLVASGDGHFNGTTNWGDSVLELTPDASRLLHNWTPADQAVLDRNDTDLGSTAPALLPPVGGRRLLVQGGKDGALRLLDLDRLDGTTGGPGPRTGGELQTLSTVGGGAVYTAAAVWSSGGRRYVFVGDVDALAAYTVTAGSTPQLVKQWSSDGNSTSPVIAGGLLYVYDLHNRALDIRSPSTGKLIHSLPAAIGHWNSPIVIGGRVILPVGDYQNHLTRGAIYIYHLPGR